VSVCYSPSPGQAKLVSLILPIQLSTVIIVE
jgi:hypothetical protein